jgi:hypothetical protein
LIGNRLFGAPSPHRHDVAPFSRCLLLSSDDFFFPLQPTDGITDISGSDDEIHFEEDAASSFFDNDSCEYVTQHVGT